MSVQFILGRSGTGKTSYCIRAVVDALLESADGRPLILLVPEQASYQAERAILGDKGVAGYNRLNVLSFDRLQFLLSGKNTARPAVSRIGRQMIIHRLLREHKDELGVLNLSAILPGLGRQMAETIAELHQYAKGPDDIERVVSELRKGERNNLVALKFADIGLILGEYLKFIEDKFIDPDIQLSSARRAVAESGFVRGARLWVDGFAGFTTAELEILAELMKAAADTHIALCVDASKINLTNPDIADIEPAGLFGATQRTYAILIDIIRKCKLKLVEPIILDKAVRFSGSRPLAHVERNIFEAGASKIYAGDSIRIVSAANIRAEVRFVARQICRLVREKGYRYRDIAVIASDIERYQHYIKAYFDDYGLPFFIDRRKSLNQHPVAALICSALQAVTGGFVGGDIFLYLKTGLVPVNDRDVDLLENYCLAFGAGGGDWQGEQDWHFQGERDGDFDEARINKVRRQVVGPLLGLRDGLCPPGEPAKTIGADEFTQIVFDFLDELGVRETIDRWIEDALERKDYAAADEHQQFYKRMVDVFDELVEVFSGRQLSCEDYLAIISSAFSQLKLAFIPPRLDQVFVGSIERSRHPDLKAVFLIGATQRQFPVVPGYSGILSDDDRIAAESADFMLSPALAQTLAERQYLAYIAFTRASEFLCVSYPLADDKGNTAGCSQFVAGLESLFENLAEQSVAEERIDIEDVYSEAELSDFLCSRLGRDTAVLCGTVDSLRSAEDKDRLEGLLDGICGDEELADLGGAVSSALSYDNCARLDKETAGQLFGRQIKSSATKLSAFAACPYQYFARYILELSKRKEFRLEPVDLGTFYHKILDALHKQLNAERKNFAAIGDEELLEMLRGRVAEYVQTDCFTSNFASRSEHNSFIIRSAGEVLEGCVRAIAQMVRASVFRPACSEVLFGEEKDGIGGLGGYKIALSDGRVLMLNGKIDRLDAAEFNGGKIAVVFDYKRRDRAFSWSRFYYGLDMQLAIYILAVRKARGSQYADCVGAFYMPVETDTPKAVLDGADKFGYKAKGVFNGEFFRYLDGMVSSGWSKFYNFQISKQNGQYGDYGRSGVMKPDDFEKLLRFTEGKIAELGEDILSGRIDVNPYRLGTSSACTYCDYRSVCRFDWQINNYNFLVPVKKPELLEKFGKK